jgi:uncharacterized hydrophobic protein (TIGR00271 family)
MLHMRVVSPAASTDAALKVFENEPGATHVVLLRGVALDPPGDVVEAAVARESADAVIAALCELGIDHAGGITLEQIDTALSDAVDLAEERAPGDAADAVVWEELVAKTGEESRLTVTFLAFMAIACLLAAVGVITDSAVTIVGAMVVGPEFGALAGVAVGLVRRTPDLVKRSAAALVVGFAIGIAATTLAALLARATGLITVADLTDQQNVEFIYHPGWFSIITAVIAGTAGMLSLASSRTAVLVGVFISVTTIPAAGNAAVAFALGQWYELGQSLLQLAINLSGIVAAGTLTLLVRRRI